MLPVLAAALWLAAAPGRVPAPAWQTSGPAYPVVEAIAIAPGDDRVVYAAARDPESETSGLFRSEDAGLTWTLLAQAPFQASVRQVAIDPTGPQRMLALTADAWGHELLYRSEDGGVSWVQTGVFVADENRTVFFDPVAPDTAYLFGTGNLARREAGGALVDVGSGYSAWISPRGDLYLAETIQIPFCLLRCVEDEIFVSRTQGRDFEEAAGGVCLDAGSIVYAPSDASVAYGTAAECQPLLRSGDGGRVWAPIETKQLSDILEAIPEGRVAGIAVDPENAETLFLSVTAPVAESGLLLRSVDGGVTWRQVPVPEPPTGPLAIGASDRLLYLGTLHGVFRLPLGRTRTLSPR